MPIVDDVLIGRIFREESGRSVATLIRTFGDIDLAEDAVQEAFALALQKWPAEGLPPNPGGWINFDGSVQARIAGHPLGLERSYGTLPAGHELRVRLLVGQGDQWVAMTAALPSSLTLTIP